MAEDWTDRHVARWRDHWLGIGFDDEVEAVITRVQRLTRHLAGTKRRCALEVGLQDFEYDTLHSLMIRETPGRASPSSLAADVGISNAGMTGRLDSLVRQGWVRRSPGTADRRRVEIEVTDSGREIWKRAMDLIGEHESALVATLTGSEQVALSRLLKKLTVAAESTVEL